MIIQKYKIKADMGGGSKNRGKKETAVIFTVNPITAVFKGVVTTQQNTKCDTVTVKCEVNSSSDHCSIVQRARLRRQLRHISNSWS
jgi:hypothetical protein